MGITMERDVIEEIDGVYFGGSPSAQAIARAFEKIRQQPVRLKDGLPDFSTTSGPSAPQQPSASRPLYNKIGQG